jgi:ABC-2 type transport system ATP-binding protein
MTAQFSTSLVEPVDASAPLDVSFNEGRTFAATPSAIDISEVSKTYPVSLARLKQFFRLRMKEPVEALRDVTLSVRRGEVFGLIGRNGAGKTTLTKIIATLVQPTSGSVSVNGYDSVRDEASVRGQIGLASAEERSFYWRLTVVQNLTFFARLYGLNARAARERIAELLVQFDLESLALRRFGELSTGNKQRMAVARALLNSPPVLLLDEPTRSLDPLAASRMRALIGSLAESDPPVTVLLTSHNLAEIEQLCARVAVISRGRIRALDTPSNLRALHKQHEHVQLIVRGITAEKAGRLLDPEIEGIEITLHDNALDITLIRDPVDDLLDRCVRALIGGGAYIVSCHAERATLLDVMESCEREPINTEGAKR